MERLTLIILLACAVIGASLHSAENPAELATDTAAAPTGPQFGNAALSADAYPLTASELRKLNDDVVVAQILERFAVRHTALPLRERKLLAQQIVDEARLFEIEPDLVMAVIEVESAGYHLAESHVGAMGLMQLLPATGRELAGKHGVEWKGSDTLFDPFINVRLGTAYLRELADRYDGNVDTALAAYNWGPGRIDRRIRRGATVPSRYIEQVRSAADRYTAIASTRS